MASPDWAPRIGAYINAAHWMAHSLQEAAGPLLLLDLEGLPVQSFGPEIKSPRLVGYGLTCLCCMQILKRGAAQSCHVRRRHMQPSSRSGH